MTREEDQVKEKFQRLLIVKSWEARFIVRSGVVIGAGIGRRRSL